MIRSVAALAAAGMLVSPFQGPVRAEPQCSPRQVVVDYLLAEFQERPVGAGIANNGGVVEVLTNPDGRSWTVLITMPDGLSCLMAAGHDWQALPLVVAVEAEPGA